MTDDRDKLQLLFTSSSKTVFTTRDFGNVWGYTHYDSLLERVEYFTKTNKLKKLRKGLYAIEGRKINEFELANKIRTPSYISFETVLHKEGVIFQWDRRITLASKESLQMEINGYKIVFRQVKDSVLLNKTGINEESNYFIASKERALLDMLYISSSFQVDNLRGIDFDAVENLLPIYGQKKLNKIVKGLKKHAGSY
ncbi:hypothetical protein A2982_01285 [candidate division WWE3 bacterium RIFCSPLOWO2_01_FULL_39_13]|uniref:AbiEi antitoxin C-terminal domain-containing protein n=1 Tax=candidate division WWE3 bacterium RIFCSPLOWO2_01_FULL_39_13 TaxID=1802624 RepID=A0A1F4V4X8_UNCKA|nr:MAG: hypothetical protein A2982_01285 [candidate division WWE3 bacterium RIFCSPLOWO2_01_FULL_39_13]